MTLASTQRQFMNWLLQDQDDLASLIEKNGQISRRSRMEIYSEAYRLRLLEALQDSFPTLHTLLGDSRFAALGNGYISRHPSQHFSIRYFGHRLAEFLSADNDDPNADLLAEIAGFEWALRAAFDAADDLPITLEVLQELPFEQWPSLQFSFHPSLQLLDLRWNTPSLWQAVEDNTAPVGAEKYDFPSRWAIWRHEQLTHYRSLDIDEGWALDKAITHGCFGEICEGICEWVDPQHAATRVAGFLARWINEGMVCKVVAAA